MTKILHVIDTTGPGGAETVFIQLARILRERHFETVTLIRGKGWVEKELVKNGIIPHIIDCKGSFNLSYLRKLIRLIKSERVDIIQSHLLGSNVYCSLAGMITRVPVISTFHGFVDIEKNERFSNIKMLILNRGSKYHVSVSNSLKKEFLSRTSLSPKKAKVIYNGIDTDFYKPEPLPVIPRDTKTKNNAIIICSVGNIRPSKGYHFLAEAALKLSKDAIDYQFQIAGDTRHPLFDDINTYIKANGLSGSIKFLGFQDDPRPLLHKADIFLLPSTHEGFSIATVEAMSCGCPVIATKSGGPEEIIEDGKTGLLIESGSSDAIAAGIRKLSDQNFRLQYSNAGLKDVEKRFTLKRMADRYQEMYQLFEKTALK